MSDWFRTYGYGDILPELWIGAYPTDEEDVATLTMLGVTRVLNLVQDQEYRPGERLAVEEALAAAGIGEHRIRLVDFGNLTPEVLDEAVDVINDWLDAGERVYAHCRAGWQRSATVAAALVSDRKELHPDSSLVLVKQMKPSADPLPHQQADLRNWYAGRTRR